MTLKRTVRPAMILAGAVAAAAAGSVPGCFIGIEELVTDEGDAAAGASGAGASGGTGATGGVAGSGGAGGAAGGGASAGTGASGGVSGSAGTGGGSAGFIAYNDLAWGAGQLDANITRYTSDNAGSSGLTNTGQLVDFATGAPVPVTLTVVGGQFGSNRDEENQGGEPDPGTDAALVFGGKVSLLGTLSYTNTSDPVTLTLSNLNPQTTYNVVFTANRGDYGWERASLVTLSGADGFVNASSTANDNNGMPLYSSGTDPSTRIAPNNTTSGWVVRFNFVAPGADGSVVLSVTFDGDAASAYQGKYASALMVKEN